jgi:hypothetical protein
MESFFIISYHGSSHNKLDKTLSSHPKLQKVVKDSTIKNTYLNCHDVIDLQKNHKYKFGGAWFYDICLENYELASTNVLKKHFFIFYFDDIIGEKNPSYVNYRLRRIYEMLHYCENCIIFFNNGKNFPNLLTNIEKRLDLDQILVEPKEYSVKIEKCFDNKSDYYFSLIKRKFGSKLLTDQKLIVV